jgi:hypothetical protein
MNKQEALEAALTECRKYEGMPEEDADDMAVRTMRRALKADPFLRTEKTLVEISGAALFMMVDEEG